MLSEKEKIALKVIGLFKKRDLAHACGVHPKTIHDWYAGRTIPPAHNMEKLRAVTESVPYGNALRELLLTFLSGKTNTQACMFFNVSLNTLQGWKRGTVTRMKIDNRKKLQQYMKN